MPVIVDEVVISVEVTNQEAGGGGAASAPPGGSDERQALVEACAERVLEILRARAER